ncbi:hypothetical protein [Pseudonocardia spinosispora]|uniref:hypothetical protein n=1 Tax=Pseudonocardia spinosispora TaxID=103441 RepID=UPI0003FB9A5B|nr:hypothetical protein [Pseudonocardia spinosispora]
MDHTRARRAPRRLFGALFAALAAATTFLVTGTTVPTTSAVSAAAAATSATPHAVLLGHTDTSASPDLATPSGWTDQPSTPVALTALSAPLTSGFVAGERTGTWSPQAGRAPPATRI